MVGERDALHRELGRLGLVKTLARMDTRERELSVPPDSEVSPWPDTPCPAAKPNAEAGAKRVADLKRLILAGIAKRKPHQDLSGPSGVFGGSYDWHSAVHAHWALLCIARVHNDPALEAVLMRRLSQRTLLAERRFLNENSCFELPYGRAWLLLMLSELVRRKKFRPAVSQALRLELEHQLGWWLKEAPFPEDRATTPPSFDGAHGSFLMTLALVALSRPVSSWMPKLLSGLVRERIDPRRQAILARVTRPSDFLDLPSVLDLIDRLLPTGAPKRKLTPEPALASAPLTAANAHTAGAAMVRLWPRAIDSAKKDPLACARFHSRMNEMFERPEQWAQSFENVAHWVPQFMWMGLWLEADRP